MHGGSTAYTISMRILVLVFGFYGIFFGHPAGCWQSMAWQSMAWQSMAWQNMDWQKVNPETLEHYTRLLKIDTTNPPGNETRAVEYLKTVLDREGILYQVLASDPKRANLVARVKGNGSKRPIIVMGHTDTSMAGVYRERISDDRLRAVAGHVRAWLFPDNTTR